jgi:type II secretory pathway pseudopilin PulG
MRAVRGTGRARRTHDEAGFTLVELLVALTLFLFVIGTAVQYLRKQSTFVAVQSIRSDALQNAEFAVSQVDRELREAGAGVVDIQPMLVQVDSDAVTFNANMVSIDSGDVRAVYQLRDADTNAVRGMLASEAVTLPNSSPARLYPDTTYLAAAGVNGSAETISYYLRPDSTSPIAGRFLLMRRVNARPPTLIARGIVKDPRDTVPLLTYFTADTLNRLVPIARTRLPLYHIKLHGDAADTGNSGLTDSVRAVRVHILVASRDARSNGNRDNLRVVETLVRMMNAGLLDHTTCGQPPLAVATPTVTPSPVNAVVKSVTISWSKSGDDGAGEKDVERYAIFRRPSTAPGFTDPITSIPASQASYSFTDTAVLPGATYVYGIAAQDCSPQLSSVSASSSVTVNP